MIMDDDQSPCSMDVTTSTATDEVLSSKGLVQPHGKLFGKITDRLPAVSGMAARFHTVRQCDFYAGLWADDFPRCLGWLLRHFHDTSTGAAPKTWSALYNRVPSWSWASIRGEVRWPHLVPGLRLSNLETYSLRIELNSELLAVECKPATQNQFGEVSVGSFVKLRGKVVDASMECDGFGHELVRRDGFAPQLVQPDCLLTQDTARPNHGNHGPGDGSYGTLPALRRATQVNSDHNPGVRTQGTVVCMLLYSIFDDEQYENGASVLLVLCKAGTNPAVYQRVAAGTGRYGPVHATRQDWKQWEGWTGLEEWDHWRAWFANAETRDVCII